MGTNRISQRWEREDSRDTLFSVSRAGTSTCWKAFFMATRRMYLVSSGLSCRKKQRQKFSMRIYKRKDSFITRAGNAMWRNYFARYVSSYEHSRIRTEDERSPICLRDGSD